MPRIVRVAAVAGTVMMKAPIKISHDVMDRSQPRVFVRVEAEGGAYGLGEAAPLTFFNGESAASIKVVIDDLLGPAVMGKEALDPRALVQAMELATPGNHTAKTGLEMALWDLAGRLTGLPVYRLIGGKVRERVPLAHVLGLKELDATVDEARDAVSRGYGTLKVKLTGDPEEDVRIIKAIRRAVGDGVSIRGDANTGYTVKNAIRAVKMLEAFNLQYLEQPCPREDPEGLKEIRDRSAIPIAADESLQSKRDALDLIRTRAVDWLVIKLIKVGGILAGLEIATLAHWAGIGCTIVSPVETCVGSAAGIHLALAAPAAVPAHELNGPEYLAEDPSRGLSFGKPYVILDDRPGLGVELPGVSFS
ncbi:MAG: mandelate racemase/muconate lactonizing enzyme family protein [Bacillota bacterium]